ncbi:MAG: nitrate reductase molybdenum cofactor assembly chaperone [Proteobacteria bacterium]|nr:nitrate reductase molybdenum cofactor assembly chaperone [Pseudomonadota bacterium]
MIATYKVLSAALSYPTADFQGAARDLLLALNAECLLAAKDRAAIGALIDDIAGGDLLEAQSRYVDLFDRTRALSLHLFEHVHGESRDRGQAMVSLADRYRAGGMEIAGKELPDYIPLFLEFLSRQTADSARAMLKEPAHILAALGERLRKRGSAYAAVFEALVALSESKPSRAALAELQETQIENPDDLEALDRIWEETEVRFGPGDAKPDTCPRADDMLRKMTIPSESLNTQPFAGEDA